MRYILTIFAALLFILSCNNSGSNQVPIQSQVDSLQLRITELETQNAAQEERIKDLEEDLEGVMHYLNEQGY